MRLQLFTFLFICFTFFFTSCKTENSSSKKQIVCTTSIIADGIQAIFGDEYEVISLMGPGVDPHGYNPRPSDITLLNEATVIVYNGLHLEGKMVELFEQLKQRKKVVSFADYIPKKDLIASSSIGLSYDPHVWFDPSIWLKALGGVGKKIAVIENKKPLIIQRKVEDYSDKIERTSNTLKEELNSIPNKQRTLITSHDAFHYFGRYFNIKVKALQGVSTTQEPGVNDVLELVDFIVKNKIKSLFIEQSVNPKALKSVRESCLSKGHSIAIGGTLYSDALGDKKSIGGTYLGMLESNVKTIIKGLK